MIGKGLPLPASSHSICVESGLLRPPRITTVPSTRIATLTQKQLGAYVQDQIKLDRFTLVLSGRYQSAWTQRMTITSKFRFRFREDSKFSGRAGLINNFDFGLAPYVSYATSYNPVIGLNYSGQLLLPETGQQTEVGFKFQPVGFNGHIGFGSGST